jgi:hypothetical protein
MALSETLKKALGGFLQAFGVSSPENIKKKPAGYSSSEQPGRKKSEKTTQN